MYLNNPMKIKILCAFSLAWLLENLQVYHHLFTIPTTYMAQPQCVNLVCYTGLVYPLSYNYTLPMIKLLEKSPEMLCLSKQIIVFFSILHTSVSLSPSYRLVVDRLYHCDFDVVISTPCTPVLQISMAKLRVLW